MRVEEYPDLSLPKVCKGPNLVGRLHFPLPPLHASDSCWLGCVGGCGGNHPCSWADQCWGDLKLCKGNLLEAGTPPMRADTRLDGQLEGATHADLSCRGGGGSPCRCGLWALFLCLPPPCSLTGRTRLGSRVIATSDLGQP